METVMPQTGSMVSVGFRFWLLMIFSGSFYAGLGRWVNQSNLGVMPHYIDRRFALNGKFVYC